MEQDQLNRIIEAALLAAAQPLTLAQLAALFGEEEKPAPGAIEKALEQLAEACAQRGVELREVASGYRYQVRQDVHPWVSRLWTERQTRYSRALLETLALIAYRQPITRGEIEQIRGVAVSTNIIRTLEERDWIRVVGYRDVPGKPALLGTSRVFLDNFNLKSLDQLPPLAEIRDLEDLEPELDLVGTAPMAPPAALDAGDAGSSEEFVSTASDPEAEPEDGNPAAETETADVDSGIEPAEPDEIDSAPLERAP
jgi:segregation and condensation protein B